MFSTTCRVHSVLFALLSISLASCNTPPGSENHKLLVAAASDLVKVSRPLGREFQAATGVPVIFSFGASGQLEQQVRQGAPFDVFAPAARSFCRSLERDGLTDGENRLYAIGRLIAWSKTLPIGSLSELSQDRVQRIAIANPRFAPYGIAAKQALENAGLWAEVESKLVYGESVAHTLELAETGNAEVALVAIALVQDIKGFSLLIDQSLHRPVEQAAVVLKDSQNKQAARDFLDFLGSAPAQRILKEYGFELP